MPKIQHIILILTLLSVHSIRAQSNISIVAKDSLVKTQFDPNDSAFIYDPSRKIIQQGDFRAYRYNINAEFYVTLYINDQGDVIEMIDSGRSICESPELKEEILAKKKLELKFNPNPGSPIVIREHFFYFRAGIYERN